MDAQLPDSPTKMTDQIQHMQRLQLAGTLASGIAHDLNNELTLILGNLEVAMDRLPPGYDVQDWLDHARSAAGRCADMSRRLQDLGRASRAPLARLELMDVIDEARLLLECIKPPHITLTIEGQPKLLILGDATEIQRVFVNLGTNAFHAMPTGGTLRIKADRYLNQVYVQVEDSGCGIPVSLQKRIFEPFFTTRAELGASGLGLATVRQIMHNHAGRVTVDSKPNQGSNFILEFPVHDEIAVHKPA
jgi:two-component system, cell cycle sensor histidine kinase and response regulator CckA